MPFIACDLGIDCSECMGCDFHFNIQRLAEHGIEDPPEYPSLCSSEPPIQ